MVSGSIFLILALLIVVLLFLARPLITRTSVTPPEEEVEENRPPSEREQLLAQKESLLETIRVLDFDHETGKIPDDLYEQQRGQLVLAAAAVLKQLDEMEGETAVDAGAYAQIDMAVAQLRQSQLPANGHGASCSQCDHALDSGDKFCVRCGHPIRA